MKYVFIALMTAAFTAAEIFADKKLNITAKKKAAAVTALITALAANCMMIVLKDTPIGFAVMLNAVYFELYLLTLWDIGDLTVPTIVLNILFLTCAVTMLFNTECNIVNKVITGLLVSFVLFVVNKMQSVKIGSGDLKVMAALSFALGYPLIFSHLFAALMLSMVYGIMLIIIKKAKLKTEIPFLPFVYAAGILNIINF